MTNGVSHAVAAARAAYASRRVPATGVPSGDTEDLSGGDDDSFAPRPIVAMPVQPPPPAAATSPALDADAIVAQIRAEVARLDACLVQRDRLAHLLRAADLWDARVPSPLAQASGHNASPAPLAAPTMAPARVAAPNPPPPGQVPALDAMISAELGGNDAETDEDRQHAEELRAWQAGGPMPSWMR